MKKLRLAILRNEVPEDHLLWVQACKERQDEVTWEVVDLTREDWLRKIKGQHFDGLLAMPPGVTNSFKSLYDERVYILNVACGIPVYPSMEEIRLLENKKFLSYWLAANEAPHPVTRVFYYEKEAVDFIRKSVFPIVGKTNIGASGRGVVILKSKSAARRYVEQTFSEKGAPRSIGPKWRQKGFVSRVFQKLRRPQEFFDKLKYYEQQRSEVQNQFVILQEYVPHDFEWRCVRIGDSFFAHKKLKLGEKASGSLLKGYEDPPLDLLDFVKEITDRHHFLSQSVDIFETGDGRYLVNEMQCIFGQSDPYQMLVDGVPGRYRMVHGGWQFEAGDFNRHESFALRLDHFIRLLSKEETAVAI